jgi:uroporphyrinogen III methyltransferase/synthase
VPVPPLAGIRVVVTRSRVQAGRLAALLAEAGARVELLPLLEVVPPAEPNALQRAARELSAQWVVFTSANAVAAFAGERTDPLPAGVAVAAVGGATAEAARRAGLDPDLVATDARAEGLLEALQERLRPGDRVLLPQASDARPVLGDALESRGVVVDRVVAYAKRRPADSEARAQRLFAGTPLGWITFTSPSTVRGLSELLGADLERRRSELRAASIGPTTSAELRRSEIEPAAEAAVASAAGLVAAIVAAVEGERSGKDRS